MHPGNDMMTPLETAPYGPEKSNRLPQGNEMFGLIYGLVAALVCGLIWYLVVTTTDRQFVYLAIAMGVVVGKAVAFGSGSSRIANACFAVVIATSGRIFTLVAAVLAGIVGYKETRAPHRA